MVVTQQNKIGTDELCLVYSGYWRTWSRVLHIDQDGPLMVEVNLTPVNPTMNKSWVEQVFPLMIRAHTTARNPDGGDRLYRYVMKNKQSIVYQEVKKAMLRYCAIELVHRLICDDFLSEICWDRYAAMRISPSYRGGGVPFALCKRKG